MKETALQQFIRLINENKCHPHTETEKLLALKWCYDLAVSLLPTEKQQIEDAWQDGQNSVQCYGGSISHYFKDYFTETHRNRLI